MIAGEVRADEFDVAAMIATLGLQGCVILTGYVSDEDFFAYLGAADMVINLRHPVGGETSGTMVRALGSGACVVLIDRGAFAEIPDDAAAKLPPFGPGFDAALGSMLLLLASDPAFRQRIGARARAYVQERNGLPGTVAGYLAAIAHAEAAPAPAWSRPLAWEYLPPPALTRQVAAARAGTPNTARLPLWFAAGAVPQATAPPKVLAVGEPWLDGDGTDLLARHLGMEIPRVPLTRFLGTPPAPRTLDLIVVRARIDRFDADERALLLAANRALGFGGIVVLDIARSFAAGARRALEDTADGERLLRESGFQVALSTATMPAWIDETPPRGPDAEIEERCWRAVKVSEFPCRPARLGALAQSAS